jgi:DNA-binding IclR family transcriptional regulator
LNARTAHTITDRKKLFEDFEEVRRTGIGCDREESILGGICFGAALRTEGRPVVAALSLSTPSVRMTKEREKEIRAAVLESGERIAQILESGAV